ncbi:hypothetical protein VD0002_g6044 [Verticillium dahliae]|uniref:Uncharacterized protein n=1 Tax=Verticillium dahliae TaxID=27337 RepID=A0AA45APM6_VERDA|nr:hypothetical protein BJF96_g2878 [Verticillium dahliae]PNH51697.1 hypothetical protein VD0003_g5556 [Verticillium dahliae]PNH61863.1 hypothetical protein VD0002_g6044 [Verticillium dahliae]
MRFAPILFNFVAGVSANDIWLNWDATDCRGKNSVHCANVSPNVCCSVPNPGSPFASIDFREITTGWSNRATGHQGSQCGNIISSQATFGQDTSVCMSFGGYGGGGYHFINDRRRSIRAREDCPDVMRPSIVSFDGVRFNLTSFLSRNVSTIWILGRSGDGFVFLFGHCHTRATESRASAIFTNSCV